MSEFELVFALFSLLLGLSIAEVLSGFGKAIKARHRVRIGWLTPLLALLVLLDLTSFFSTIYVVREQISARYLTLMLMLGFTGLYYLAASLVFPDNADDRPDFDDHYWENRRLVLAAVFLLNVPQFIYDFYGGHWSLHPVRSMITTIFFALLAIAWVAKRKGTNLALLTALIALYPLNSIGAVYVW